MYEHIVCFKFNETYRGEKDKLLIDKLLSFKEHIPGIVELTVGINETEETQNHHGYSLGLRVTFQSKEALSQYGPHPVHREFVKLLDGILDNVVVVDYPVQA